MTIIYKEDGVTLKIGDKLELLPPEENNMFYNSRLGKLFKEGRCDKAYLEVKQKPWLEIYFVLTLEKEGKLANYFDINKKNLNDVMPEVDENSIDSVRLHEYNNEVFKESADYSFLRYFIKKGATIFKNET